MSEKKCHLFVGVLSNEEVEVYSLMEDIIANLTDLNGRPQAGMASFYSEMSRMSKKALKIFEQRTMEYEKAMAEIRVTNEAIKQDALLENVKAQVNGWGLE